MIGGAAAASGDRRGPGPWETPDDRARRILAEGVPAGAWPVAERAGDWWETLAVGVAVIVPHWTRR